MARKGKDVAAPVSPMDGLFDRVVANLEQARARVVRSVNSEMVLADRHIGREIVEHVQAGKERAECGKRVIEELADRLRRRYGRGFSATNLRYIRNFYEVYSGRVPEIRHLAGGELGRASAAGPKRHTRRGVLDDLTLAVNYAEGTRQGKTVLVQLHDATDPESGERYTVKRYESEKTAAGDSWSHARITLKPINPDFQPIVLTGAEEGEVQVIAECVEVLGGGS